MSDDVTSEVVETPAGPVAIADSTPVAATATKRGRGRTPDPKSKLSQARVLFAGRAWTNAKEFVAEVAPKLGVNEKVATTYYYLAKKGQA